MQQYRIRRLLSPALLGTAGLLISACGGGGGADGHKAPAANTKPGAAIQAASGASDAAPVRQTAASQDQTVSAATTDTATESAGPSAKIAATTVRTASTTPPVYTTPVDLPSKVSISSITPSTPIVPRATTTAAASLADGSAYTTTFSGKGYYVNSAAGSDANPGTLDKPWKTLAKAATAKLNAGDALLLSCEGKWREAPVEFGTTFAPAGSISIGAYGTCSHTRRPIVYGSTQIPFGAWSPVRTTPTGTVYVANVAQSVVAVARGEKLLMRARFPNATSETHLSLSRAGNTAGKLVLSEVDRQAVGAQALVGGTAVIRSAPWQIEAATISGYAPDTGAVSLATALNRTPPTGSGYFLEGQAWMLDSDGEWLHDAAAGLLYIFLAQAPLATDPLVEVMQATSPFTVKGIPKVRIEHLAVINSGEHGIRVIESGEAVVSNVVAQRIRLNGIHAQSTTNKASAQKVTIESSTLRDIGVMGIASWLSGTRIQNNTLTNIGTQAGSSSPIAAIKISEGQSVISGNVINNTGFNAISIRNRPELDISDNTVTNACTRLTDCAGIYSWDNSGSSTARSRIAHNSVYHVNNPALLGAVGGSPDLLVGIYIDESTNNMDVTSNNLGNVSVGINVHKAVNNLVSGNTINVASAAGIRVESSGAYADSVRSNRIEANTIFVPRYFLPASAPGEIPRSAGGIVMEWAHQSDVQKLLSGTNKTTAANNVTVHLGDTPSMRYRLRSGATTRDLLPAEWAAYAPSDRHVSPFRAEMATITGTQLIKDSTIDTGSPVWTSYSYQKGASIVSFGVDAACGSNCASLTPATSNDVLMQVSLPVSDYAKKMMFLRYRVIAKGSDTTSKVEVRSNIPPHAEAGYLEPATLLPANSERRSETFFKRTLDSDLRISVKGQVGSTLYLDDVQLYQVDSFLLINPLSLGRVLSNMSGQTQSISCANLRLVNCEVLDEKGTVLNWPIELPAGTNKLFFLRSADWRYQ